jgi:hypothetical protein
MECSTHGGDEECIQGLGGKSQEERDHYEDLDLGGRIILKWIFEKLDGIVWGWIHLTKDKETVAGSYEPFHKMFGNS